MRLKIIFQTVFQILLFFPLMVSKLCFSGFSPSLVYKNIKNMPRDLGSELSLWKCTKCPECAGHWHQQVQNQRQHQLCCEEEGISCCGAWAGLSPRRGKQGTDGFCMRLWWRESSATALNVLNREDVIHAEKEKQAVVDAEKAKQP